MTEGGGKTGEILVSSNDYLLTSYAAARQEALEAHERAGRIEQEILRRIQVSGGTAIPSDTFVCEMKVSNSYDQTRFIPLKEELNKTEMDHCWEPEYVRETVVPGKFNTTKLKAVVNKRGGRAKELFEDAMLPGVPSLVFSQR